MADMEFAGDYGRAQSTPKVYFGNLVNWAGAIMSVALVAGIGLWGYKLMVRDVNGIPVVASAEGPMRIQPDDPGGLQAAHQGLAINHVKADGGAEAPADTLRLAPPPVDVAETDQPGLVVPIAETVQTMAEAEDASVAAAEAAAQPVSLVLDDTGAEPVIDTRTAVENVLAEILQGSEPLSELAVDDNVPGLSRSYRPALRPARAALLVASADPSQPILPASIDVKSEDVPSGTRLVQLGAFDSPETAKAEWDRITTRFEGYMDEKSRVIQRAESGGRTFYRLRAMGFADLSDARRFCSALVAGNAACIPVVVR